MGDPEKRGRVLEEDFLAALDVVREGKPDVLLLHQGPDASKGRRGSPDVAARILASKVPLTVCGHVFWKDCLAELSPEVQTINVDSRAVLLTRGPAVN